MSNLVPSRTVHDLRCRDKGSARKAVFLTATVHNNGPNQQWLIYRALHDDDRHIGSV